MKKQRLIACISIIFAAELLLLFLFAARDDANLQDTVAVNEVLHAVQDGWGKREGPGILQDLDYVVLDTEGNVLYGTRRGLSESINQAVMHRDTVLDITVDGRVTGKLILYNDSVEYWRRQKRALTCFFGLFLLLQWGICAGYLLWLDRSILKPFHKLKDFARRVAGGNLDMPMEMDRRNVFGAFTESFDIMRAELKKARKAEAKANASKRELVAGLSHDIRTPVASIRAAAEVGAALAEHGGGMDCAALLGTVRENYAQIIRKSDQISGLVNNLFTAALEDLERLSVSPGLMESRELCGILENADYLHRGRLPEIPDCLLWADRFRLQQVFDNLFANSYKYAGTQIRVEACRDSRCLRVTVDAEGGGVREEELPLLKEKLRRGQNAGKAEGAGLGLYISDYFMREMEGGLLVENGEKGLRVTVVISQGGR